MTNSTHPTRSVHRSTRRAGGVLLAGLGLAAVAGLAGCGNGVDSTTDTTPTETVSVTPSPSPASSSVDPSPSASGSSSGAAGSSGASTSGGGTSSSGGSSGGGSSSGTGRCDVGQLAVGVRAPRGSGAAGSTYVLLTFANKGGSSCYLDGHPGVSFVGKGNGTQIGTSADRTGPVKKVVLAAGKSTSATLRIENAGNFGSRCDATAADGFRVYPPGSKQSVFVHYSTQACATKLGRGSSQLEISAVGDQS